MATALEVAALAELSTEMAQRQRAAAPEPIAPAMAAISTKPAAAAPAAAMQRIP